AVPTNARTAFRTGVRYPSNCPALLSPSAASLYSPATIPPRAKKRSRLDGGRFRILRRFVGTVPVMEDRPMRDETPPPPASETKPATAGKISARLKTLLGSIAGLLSGAFMMYVSPLVDKVISPAKPVANFGVEYNGLTVAFTNQSANGSE